MQQIIVYRNPAEAAFWDMIMSSPNLFPIMVGIVVFFNVLIFSTYLVRKSKQKMIYNLRNSYFPLIVSAICGIFTVWYMWI